MRPLAARVPTQRAIIALDPAMAELLDCAGPIDGAHAIVIGAASLEVMCALIQRGCVAATELHAQDRPSGDSAEIAFITEAADFAAADRAVALARRMLSPGGRILICDRSGRCAPLLRAVLCGHGLSAIRVHAWRGGCIVHGERPSFDLRGGVATGSRP